VLLVGWSLAALFGLIVYLLMKSPWGRVLKAIREDEDAVRSLGKNVFSYKMQALILGGVIGTFGGMILALGTANVQPDNYSRDLTFFVLTGLVLGGVAKVSGSIVGPMLFWAIYAFLSSFLRQLVDKPWRIGDTTIMESTDIGAVVFMVMGLLLVALMVFRPQGLFGNRKEMAFEGR
jgi:branched-chain amino acid transport system permease protein